MVAVGVEIWILVILLILTLGLQIEGRFSSKSYLDEYDQALDEMKYSLDVVAQVLHKLPDMIPQFNLVNENPLGQILQFFQGMNKMKEESNQYSNLANPSLDDAPFRDAEGRFTNGEGQSEEITQETKHSD